MIEHRLCKRLLQEPGHVCGISVAYVGFRKRIVNKWLKYGWSVTTHETFCKAKPFNNRFPAMTGFLKTYRSVLLYTLSVAFGRGLSIFVLPFVARLMPPGDYARLDVAASILEICGLIASFALADLMFRFAASAKSDEEQRKVVSDVLGIGLVSTSVIFIVSQIFFPMFADQLALGIDRTVLRAGLLAAVCTGLIELPMAWLRMKNRAGMYTIFITGRSVLQISLTLLALNLGYGPEGVVLSTAAVDFSLTIYLTIRQIRTFGVTFSKVMMLNALGYAMPVVGGALAMFGLGTCDRFFLAGTVRPEILAHYTLAGKLALATSLLLQPFILWWHPKRIALLAQPDGLVQSARFVSIGLTALILSALTIIFSGTLFLHLVMPDSYHGAIYFLPFLVFVSVMHEICIMFSTGSLSRNHGGEVLLVNGLGGATAVLFYALLVPGFAIFGAILATIAGHCVRATMFLALGHKSAPIRYPLVPLMIMIASAALLVYFRPSTDQIFALAGFGFMSLGIVLLEAIIFGLVPLPPAWRRQIKAG